VGDTEQRRDHPGERDRDRLGEFGAARSVAFLEQREQLDRIEQHCRAARDRAAVVEQAGAERAEQAGLAERLARFAAGDQQARRNDSAPGGDAGGAGGGLVGGAIEVECALGERVEHLRAIYLVGGGQDQRRVRGPGEDAAAPHVRAPRDPALRVGVRGQPEAHEVFGDRGAARAGCDGRQVA
jgi:hypothetical protein